MSFILDAIAKSERERQQQEVPDARILAIPADDASPPRRYLSYLLIGSLLLIIILLIIWMQTDRSRFDASLQPQYNVDESIGSSQMLAEISQKPLNEALTAGVDTPLVDDSNALPSGPASQQSSDGFILDDAVTRKDTISPNLIEDVENTAEAEDIDKNRVVAREINTQSDSFTGSPVVANQASMPTAQQPPASNIYRLRDLPDDVRRDLPSVVFKGHLYSKNPNVSYVMVDGGRSVVAGQQIADEVLLHAITPQGVIVDFRGFLIEIGILQNWSLK